MHTDFHYLIFKRAISSPAFVTFHAKTCYNDFPLNGWNERPSNGLQTGHQAVLNGFQWVFERVIKYSERVA